MDAGQAERIGQHLLRDRHVAAVVLDQPGGPGPDEDLAE